MKKNEIITSVMARCTVDPDFMQLILQKPHLALQEYAEDKTLYKELLSYDYSKVLLFAGFITKIKNNNTWSRFPRTRKLLKHFQLEQPFFTNYYPTFVDFRKNNKPSPDQKLAHFAEHLHKFLSQKETKEAQLTLALLNHRKTLMALNASQKDQKNKMKAAQSNKNLTLDSIMQLAPGIDICKAQFNPIEIIKYIDTPDQLLALEASENWLLYQLKQQQLFLSIQEEWTAMILSLIDGKHSIKQLKHLLEALTQDSISGQELLDFFSNLMNQQVVVTIYSPID